MKNFNVNKTSQKLDRPIRFWRFLPRKMLIIFLKIFALSKIVSARIITGDRMKVVLPENVSTGLFYRGYFEKKDTHALLKVLKEGDTFLDIGAHLGYFSIIAARMVGTTGQVHAFEPTPSTFKLLKENCAGIATIKLNNRALLDKPGNIQFNDFGLRYMALNSITEPRHKMKLEREKINVTAITLDDYCVENKILPDFIKMDAESSELLILKGGIDTLQKSNPVIMIEVGDFSAVDGQKTIDIIRLFQDLQYHVFDFDGELFTNHEIKASYGVMNLFFSKKELESSGVTR